MNDNRPDWRCPSELRVWLSSVHPFQFVVLRVTS